MLVKVGTMECPVCCDSFTSQKRKRVICAQCQYSACQECYRKYLLNTQQDPHCMSCMHAWDSLFLRNQFPVSWLHREYKEHRERVLLERERQLLPDTQHMVANYRNATEIRRTIRRNTREVTRLRRELSDLRDSIQRDTYRLHRLEYNNYNGYNGTEERPRGSREFMYRCPMDDCRGYMPESTMACGVCTAVGCKQCGCVMTEENHVCDPNMRANFEAVKKTSKPCPKCAAPTSKIDGCDQMWCTVDGCHTAWSWSTGEIVRGVVHNPHYFAYLREHSSTGDIPRQPGDTPHGGCRNERVPSGWEVNQRSRGIVQGLVPKSSDDPSSNAVYSRAQELAAQILGFTRKCLHISFVVLADRRNRDDTAGLRLQYLINHLTEADFQVQLQRYEKKRLKQKDLNDIYDMVVETGGEILWSYVTGEKTMKDTMDQITSIRTYANTHLRHVENRYKMSAEYI